MEFLLERCSLLSLLWLLNGYAFSANTLQEFLTNANIEHRYTNSLKSCHGVQDHETKFPVHAEPICCKESQLALVKPWRWSCPGAGGRGHAYSPAGSSQGWTPRSSCCWSLGLGTSSCGLASGFALFGPYKSYKTEDAGDNPGLQHVVSTRQGRLGPVS